MLEPGIFGTPQGADLPRALSGALSGYAAGGSPERLASVLVFVNTRRMARRLTELLSERNLLLPKIRLVSEIGIAEPAHGLPPPVPPLRRRLELMRLAGALIAAAPDEAPGLSAASLAESLLALMDEMQGEGVALDAIEALDVEDQSGHWARSKAFLSILGRYLAAAGPEAPDPSAHLRLATLALSARWRDAPPEDPVIVAGSTGSRGTTSLLMRSVARLPRGIVILPGFDFDMDGAAWDDLIAAARRGGAAAPEDHPQYRFARFLATAGLASRDVRRFPCAYAPDPGRNRLISLSLRPAPVTDQWLAEGPGLGDLTRAARQLTLIEARDPGDEAQAIALILREAARVGRRAALVTPNRMMTRRVTAFLDRWGIEPDDSAGRPLALSAPGRLIRQAVAICAGPLPTADLLSLLKNPLTHTGADRGRHLRHARDLELFARRGGLPEIAVDDLHAWAREEEERGVWASWLAGMLRDAAPGPVRLETLAGRLDWMVVQLAAGSAAEWSDALWDKPAGQAAQRIMQSLLVEARHGDDMEAREFEALVTGLLEGEEVRDPETPHPSVMIWGTLEARVGGADLVILGGLNEGSWPETPAPDPWLNRAMRAEAELLLPERRIGLSAHDYSQAAGAPEAILTRPLKEADADPVPSRWLNRLTNLMAGLTVTGGPEALAEMRARGDWWLAAARALDAPEVTVARAARPAPRPPVAARPRSLSVTRIERLIRDPYAIYARHVLNLARLDPIRPRPDAALRGTVLHRVLERFMTGGGGDRDALMAVADAVLAECVRWPVARSMWRARIERFASRFLAEEAARGTHVRFEAAEVRGRMALDRPAFDLTGTADRIDRLADGSVAIVDYKSGKPPTTATMEHFDKQLLLEALIAEAGGFEGIAAAPVDHVAHVGLSAEQMYREHRLEDTDKQSFSMASVRDGLARLIASYLRDEQGYASRLAVQMLRFEGDYDHLARFGEWDDADAPVPEQVGHLP